MLGLKATWLFILIAMLVLLPASAEKHNNKRNKNDVQYKSAGGNSEFNGKVNDFTDKEKVTRRKRRQKKLKSSLSMLRDIEDDMSNLELAD